MKALHRLFDIYIHGSIHVAFAVLALTLMTLHMFALPFDSIAACFAFCGTVAGYNFVKYESLFRHRKPISLQVKLYAFITVVTGIGAGISFLMLTRAAQLWGLFFFGLTLLYTVPFFPNRKNMRNWTGIKIYMVALCWAGITTLVPLLNAGVDITQDVLLKFVQRFVLVIILILIFEIIDSMEDDPLLKTVPQRIGVRNTKIVNFLLLALFYCLEFFKSDVDAKQLAVNVVLVVATTLFTLYATPERPKYYTLFWVESIPIFWLGLVIIVSNF
ncbi:hypothetical protein KJK34_08795 [Flavobacterium sp. D11R37]|uniref:hypothetical protein n=1 Tax=Flavobacterium coralii TaxID=2838017 RepID=UPI001CA5F67B|nr:hypothetical protein [Flavobacterium coralii]MBY8962844.1 hypothetical protein [Flavobacterium coralii]